MNLSSQMAVRDYCTVPFPFEVFWLLFVVEVHREIAKPQYRIIVYNTAHRPLQATNQPTTIMKSFVGILLPLLCVSTPLAVASQQYYDDYGEDAGGDYYQQQDYGAPAGGDYYGDEGGGDTLYQDYAQHQQDKAMGKGGV